MDTLSLMHHNKCGEASPLFWMEESLKMFGLIFTSRYMCMYVYIQKLLLFCLLKEKKNHLLTRFSPFCLFVWKKKSQGRNQDFSVVKKCHS